MLDKPAAFYRRIIRENPGLIRPMTRAELDAHNLALGIVVEPEPLSSASELPPGETWLTKPQACEFLGGVSLTTVDRYVRAGILTKMVVKNSPYYTASSLEVAKAKIDKKKHRHG